MPLMVKKFGRGALHGHRREGVALAFVPFLELDEQLLVGSWSLRGVLRLDEQRAVQAECLLAVDLGVGVVEERPGLLDGELVGE